MTNEEKSVIQYILDLPILNMRKCIPGLSGIHSEMSRNGKIIHCYKLLKMMRPVLSIAEAKLLVDSYLAEE
jgi:hypothetical protein